MKIEYKETDMSLYDENMLIYIPEINRTMKYILSILNKNIENGKLKKTCTRLPKEYLVVLNYRLIKEYGLKVEEVDLESLYTEDYEKNVNHMYQGVLISA